VSVGLGEVVPSALPYPHRADSKGKTRRFLKIGNYRQPCLSWSSTPLHAKQVHGFRTPNRFYTMVWSAVALAAAFSGGSSSFRQILLSRTSLRHPLSPCAVIGAAICLGPGKDPATCGRVRRCRPFSASPEREALTVPTRTWVYSPRFRRHISSTH
jgi:hypothetical protein